MSLQGQSSSVGSECLKKAIERNRQKQLKRMYKSSVTDGATDSAASSVIPDDWKSPPTSRPATRKRVARVDDLEFLDRPSPRSRSTLRSTAYPVSTTKRATRTTRTRKKASQLLTKWQRLGIKGAWIFLLLLTFRLVFSQGGVVDFYGKKATIANRLSELEAIKKENKTLLKDIDLLAHDRAFQKQMVRENLGFISSDEFLILFAKDSSSSSKRADRPL